MPPIPQRPRSTLFTMLLLWVTFYAGFTLFTPPLLDDADSVHAEVAREMLVRQDYVTMYANGVRYLEKAPLLYWSMAASMRAAMLFGAHSAQAMAAACRFPIALAMLALALLMEALARRMFASARTGLYTALITLSCFGLFIFTRLALPDAYVCLWLALALFALWNTEQQARPSRANAALFAVACALNVLSKGLIGLVFPIGIVLVYLLLTRGMRGAFIRARELHIGLAALVFFALAAPWHILAGLANPSYGHAAPFVYTAHHWQVPLPTDGNVRGWFWFYFMNEHLLRYLNMRVPHDYDTSPLWLFWGLCLAWLFPWSAFVFKAVRPVIDLFRKRRDTPGAPGRDFLTRVQSNAVTDQRATVLLFTWAAFVLLFFALSSRQEYYVLPALPALIVLIAAWLTPQGRWAQSTQTEPAREQSKAMDRCLYALLAFGFIYAGAAAYFFLRTRAPGPMVDLSTLLTPHPADYTLSMGHFLDLNASALRLFHPSLVISGMSLFLGPVVAFALHRRGHLHAANLALVAETLGLLVAAHLALQTFAPVLSSAQLAEEIAPQLRAQDMVAIHGEYESGSSLGFYLQRDDIHIVDGRSSNLWYGSFFPDAPKIFETPQSFAAKWAGPQRIFLWQAKSLPDAPKPLGNLPGAVYVIASGGGKEILSNQPNR